ncbi:MAG: hypothetical protein K0S93_2102 [Nitrososphaeraceae archaeon]|jgi:hypothetical protein|nr:hypothetical protein [Nitrososphaeraceae archaeon]
MKSLLLLIIIIFVSFSIVSYSFGSPSFVNQQIDDGIRDGIISFGVKNKELVNSCTSLLDTYKLVPDILFATYLSDGKTLNATLWLTNSSETNYSPYIGSVSLLPIENNKFIALYLTNIAVVYDMIIDVISVYDEGTDYSVTIEWDNKTEKWYENIKQLSKQEDKHRKIKSTPLPNFSEIESDYNNNKLDYINYYLDLKQINYPSDYKIMFRTFSYINTTVMGIVNTTSIDENTPIEAIEKRKIECNSQDVTDRAAIPPPKFEISMEPSSLTLQPGQKGEIIIKVNSSTNLNSRIIFSPQNETKGLNLEFIPSEISLPAKGKVTSTLLINSLNNTKLNNIIPIKSEIVFPQIFKYKSSYQNITESGNNTGISLMIFPQVIVREPIPIHEQINELFTTFSLWLQNFGGIIGTVGTIATGFVTLFAFFGKTIGNKMKNRDKKSNEINNIKVNYENSDNTNGKKGAPF